MSISRKDKLPPPAARDETALRIKATQEALGVSPRFIYEQTGISQKSWSNYVNGVSRPNLEDGIRFCERFGIPMDWIYRGDKSRLPHEIAVKIDAHIARLKMEDQSGSGK